MTPSLTTSIAASGMRASPASAAMRAGTRCWSLFPANSGSCARRVPPSEAPSWRHSWRITSSKTSPTRSGSSPSRRCCGRCFSADVSYGAAWPASLWQTVRELMAAAVEEPNLRPGMVSVIQTFGDRINPHPHVHALVSRGGWTRDDRFIPIPYVAPPAQGADLRAARGAALVVEALWFLRPQHRPRSAGRSDRPRGLAALHDAAALGLWLAL